MKSSFGFIYTNCSQNQLLNGRYGLSLAMRKKNKQRKATLRVPKKRSTKRTGSRIVQFFRLLFFVFLAILFLVLAGYYFVIPSIIGRTFFEKNIVIVSDKLDVSSKHIYFAHISNVAGENDIYSLDAQQVVTVPNGYGEYPLQSVYQLLLIDKKDSQFIRSVFSHILGVPIDEVVPISAVLDDVRESEFPRLFLTKEFRNWDMHYFTKHISLIDVGKIDDLVKYSHDFTTVKGDVFQHCSVAIVNATGQNGVARQIGDIIEKTGALVVRVDDTKVLQEKTHIYFSENQVDCGQLAHSISGVFSKEPELASLDKLENAQQYRAQVVVIVGNNL